MKIVPNMNCSKTSSNSATTVRQKWDNSVIFWILTWFCHFFGALPASWALIFEIFMKFFWKIFFLLLDLVFLYACQYKIVKRRKKKKRGISECLVKSVAILPRHFFVYIFQYINEYSVLDCSFQDGKIAEFFVWFSWVFWVGFSELKILVSWNHRMVNLVIHGILDEFALRVRYVGDYAKPKHRRSTNFEWIVLEYRVNKVKNSFWGKNARFGSKTPVLGQKPPLWFKTPVLGRFQARFGLFHNHHVFRPHSSNTELNTRPDKT